MTQPSTSVERNSRLPVRLLAIGQIALLAATLPLWIPLERVPLISLADQIPRFAEWGLFGLLLVSLGTMAVGLPRRCIRPACLLSGLSSFSLVCIDQHRLQPWACQFLILSIVLALADDSTARTCWRWLVISIYAWSAWSKIDQGFFAEHGRFLLEGFLKAIGLSHGTASWPMSVRLGVTASIPVLELLIAIGLAWQRTRPLALVGSVLMHATLLLALGPLGHRHQPGVLLWNLFFIVQNILLFRRTRVSQSNETSSETVPVPMVWIGNRVAQLAVSAAILWPTLEPFGLCDHWPAWAVYAAKPERVTVFVSTEELSQLPAEWNPYVEPERSFDEWHPLRIDRWSLDTVYAPIYPQDRFQVGVTIFLAEAYRLKQIRVVIEGPANRWTGKRSKQEFVGADSLMKLANTFRCNALPHRRLKREH